MTKQTLTQDELIRLVAYDPDTGVFTNNVQRNRRRAKKGAVCGCLTRDGYICIQVLGKKYQAHRLAWLYMTGDWPAAEIDHINRVRNDNRWVNLRAVSRMENSWNTNGHQKSKSGHKGVAWSGRHQKWQVQLRVRHKSYYVGLFETLNDAVTARRNAEIRLYGIPHAEPHI